MENNAAASGDRVTPVEIVKVCKVHGGLMLDSVYQGIKRGKLNYLCKKCGINASLINYAKNKDAKLLKARQYYAKNREACLAASHKWGEKNKERKLATCKAAGRRAAANLSDYYVKSLLASTSKILKWSDITDQNLIDLKRTTLLIKRSIRNGQHS